MRVYETKEITSEQTLLVKHECDKCGESLTDEKYEIREVTITTEVGSTCGDGGSKTVREIDCCVTCFDAVVLPALEALGFTATEHEDSW